MQITSMASLAFLLSSLLAVPCSAVDYKNEFDKKVKATQNIGALGDNLAGDSVNFYNGVTSFSATDASLPGNSALAVAVGRKYDVEFDHLNGRHFGDWDIDVPYLTTVVAADLGWVVGTTQSTNRCNVSTVEAATPPSILVESDDAPLRNVGFSSYDYWHGYSLHLPGGDQPMLLAGASGAPTSGVTYRWTTKQDWWFSCMPTEHGGGEGFRALSPDGTEYEFDWLGVEGVEAVTKEVGDVTNPDPGELVFHGTLNRGEMRLLPTLVTDRFGNWVQYHWLPNSAGRLDKITSSDGRQITLTYESGLVKTVSDGTRIWTYGYSNGSLTTVTQSDGSFWNYDFSVVNSLHRPEPVCYANVAQPDFDCYGGGYIAAPPPAVATVKHPSGARVDFTFETHFQPSNSSGWLGYYPLGLREKTISGPGLTAATWKYGIAPSMEQTRTACRAGTCPTRLVTDELAPDNTFVRRIFGLAKGVDESLLLGELHGNLLVSTTSAGTPRITCSARWDCDILDDPSPITGTVPVFYKESDIRYVPQGDPVDYQRVVGTNPFFTGDLGFSAYRQPIKTRIVTLQGATFTSTTNDFDEFARPESVTGTSAGLIGNPGETGFTHTESTTYRHDKAKWVIGQVATTGLNGKEVSKTDYDANALPIRIYSFGSVRQTLTYDFATPGAYGALKTVADGRGNITSMGNWMRGVPKNITFPLTAAGAASQSADVNNIGNLNWTTNELGSTTNYGYDAMGRLSAIAYPTEGTFSWNPLNRQFIREPLATEYGIPPGHWKQIVNTGTGKTTTFYDGRWNPVLTLTQDTAVGSSQSVVVRRFDAMGRETFRSYPVALANVNDVLQGVVTVYDALGRAYQYKQDSELGVLTATTEYISGFRTRVTNPRGFQTTTSHQAWDAPSADKPVRIIAPQGITTQITRDAFGKPSQITRSGPGS